MKITLFQNLSPSNALRKELYSLLSMEGNLRDGCDVSSPSIIVDLSDEMISKGYEFKTIVISDENRYVQQSESKNVVVAIRESVLNCSFAFVEAFNRYYFVRRVVALNNRLWRIDMACDVLMSFATDILKQKAFILRSENKGNRLLKDSLISFSPEIEIVRHERVPQTYSVSPYFKMDFEENPEWHFGMNVYCSGTNASQVAKNFVTYNMFEGVTSPVYGDSVSLASSCVTYVFQDFKSILSFCGNIRVSQADSYVFSAFSVPFNLKERFQKETASTVAPFISVDKLQIGSQEFEPFPDSDKPILLRSSLTPIINVGEFEVPTLEDFSQLSPSSTWAMYVPFGDFVDIPFEEVQGHRLFVCYQMDLQNVVSNYYLIDKTSNRIIASGKSEAIQKMAFSSDNSYRMDIAKSMESYSNAFGATQTAVGLLGAPMAMTTGSPYALVSGLNSLTGGGFSIAESLIRQSTLDARYRPTASLKTGSASLARGLSLTPILFEIRQKRLISDSEYSDFAKMNGVPCNRVHLLSELEGFAKIASVNLEGIDSATESERNEIISSLQSGVIFPYNVNEG